MKEIGVLQHRPYVAFVRLKDAAGPKTDISCYNRGQEREERTVVPNFANKDLKTMARLWTRT